jgi:hypothetical protein
MPRAHSMQGRMNEGLAPSPPYQGPPAHCHRGLMDVLSGRSSAPCLQQTLAPRPTPNAYMLMV